MKEGWEYKKFVDVCNVQYGYAFDSKYFTDDETAIPLIRIRDVVRGYSETFYNGDIPQGYTINEGDYLVGMDGEFNIGRWGKRAGLLNQRVCKFASSSLLLDNQFMYYFMKVCLKKIEDETPFVTVKHLSAKRINQIIIPLPPLSEQQAIVAELDKINEIIDMKKTQLKDLDLLAQSVFYDMFGDPIDNPKGWKIKKYGECFVIGSGGTPSKTVPEYWENGSVPWIGSNMCQNCFIYETDGKYITEEGLHHSSAKKLESGTVLVALVGATIGKVALLKTSTSTNQNIAFIKVNEAKSFVPEYVYYHLMGQYDEFMHIGNGDFKMANQAFIKSRSIMCPPLSLQQSFADKIEAIESQKSAIKQSLTEVETLLASRMDYYFN